MWNDEQRQAWQRIVDFVHEHTTAKFCLQLGHSGRKGSTQVGWERTDYPLANGNWELISASPLPYFPDRSSVPREMTRADMDCTVADYARAAELAQQAGFDLLEIHMAHGYLLASFISPLISMFFGESGLVDLQFSINSADFLYGVAAARMRFPRSLGQHAAFWLQPRGLLDTGPTPWGAEIDVVEWYGAHRSGGDLRAVSLAQLESFQASLIDR